MTDRIFGLAIAALALLVWYLFHRADTEVEASVNRALGPVVPVDALLHEQDSAEAYDDLPERTDGRDMQSELRRAGWVETGPGYWVKNASADDEIPLEDIQPGDVEALALIGSVCADLDDLLLTSEEDAR